MDWFLITLATISIISSASLVILLDREKYKGKKLGLFLFINIVAMLSLSTNFYIQKHTSHALSKRNDSLNSDIDTLKSTIDTLDSKLNTINSQNIRLLQENTLFTNSLKDIEAQNDSISNQLQPFLSIAISKYPEMSDKLAMQNLQSYIIQSFSKITPFIKYYGFECVPYTGKLPYSQLTQFTFQAVNGDCINIDISIEFICSDFAKDYDILSAIRVEQFTRFLDRVDSTGINFKTGILQNGSYLLIKIYSNEAIANFNIQINQ